MGIFSLMINQELAPVFGIGGFLLFFAGLAWPPCQKPLPTVHGEIVSEMETIVVIGEPI